MLDEHVISQLHKRMGRGWINHFRSIVAKHGKVSALWMDGGIPHPVHFREGIDIRNMLRDITDHSWSVDEYDDQWADYVEAVLALPDPAPDN